jgi:hypothetical protein
MSNSLSGMSGMSDPWAEELGRFEAVPLPELVPPDPEALLEGTSPPDWLLDEAKRLAGSEVFIDRLAAAGFVARLGAASTTDSAAVLERLLAGGESPGDRARKWALALGAEASASALGAEALDAAELLFVNRSGRLAEELFDLSDLVTRGGAASARAVRSVCRERDLLESAVWILRVADRGRLARASLDTLDWLAWVNLSAALNLVGPLDDEVLAAVRWQEPNAWWAL